MHVDVMTLPNQPQVPETLTNDHVSKSLQNLHKGCRDDRNPDASMSAVSYCSEQGTLTSVMDIAAIIILLYKSM